MAATSGPNRWQRRRLPLWVLWAAGWLLVAGWLLAIGAAAPDWREAGAAAASLTGAGLAAWWVRRSRG